MIAFIDGKIVQKNPENILVLVGGLAFDLQYGPGMGQQFPALGEDVRVWTYMNVRENEISLYAFPNQETKKLFELLITVSGIGPKVAGAIVASISLDAFALAVLNDDSKKLTTIKGIGKKGAQRIILELKDKLKKALPDLSSLPAASMDLPHAEDIQGFGHAGEAVAALMVLGYAEAEAGQAVELALKKQAEAEELGLEELLKAALRELAII